MKRRSRVCSTTKEGLRLLTLVAIWFALGLPVAVVRGAEPEETRVSIFDGKTLNGWDGNPNYWRVDQGTITGETTEENPLKSNTFLIWRGGEIGDFELTLEYHIVGGNSGIQYRSREDLEKWGKWVVGGYQADVDSPKEPRWCGVLYEEQGRGFLAKRGQKTVVGRDHQPKVVETIGDSVELYSHIKFEAWNTYHIVAKGYHFVHKINDQVMIEATDNDTTARRNRGLLALQLHRGDPMKVQFRNLRLKQDE